MRSTKMQPLMKQDKTGMNALFLFLFVKRLLSNLNIMSLVAVKKRKSGKNRTDRNKVDRKVRKKGKFPVCVFSSSSGSRPIRLQ